MTQRRQFLRHDYNPSLASGTGFQVAEGIVRLIAHGLSTGESIGIEMRLYSNGDERWTPYAPCNGQLALTNTNTVIRIADTGEYRLAVARTLAPVVVLLQEDEFTADSKIVYNVPVSACLPEAGSGGGTTHPPLTLSVVSGALTSLDGLNQILTVNNDPAPPTHPPLTLATGSGSGAAINNATQELSIPTAPDLTHTIPDNVSGNAQFSTLTYDKNEGASSYIVRTVDSALVVRPITNVELAGVPVVNIASKWPVTVGSSRVSLYINGVQYKDPTYVTITVSGSTILVGGTNTNDTLYSTVITVQWLNVFTVDSTDHMELQYVTGQ